MNMVCCMLLKKQVLKEFWLEVVNWTICMLNQCSTLVVKDMTSEEE
jgi:hypothetical protein